MEDDNTPVAEPTAGADNTNEPVAEPRSMDDIIEEEAKDDELVERGEAEEVEDEEEELADDAEEPEEEEPEEEPEEEEPLYEPEPVDTTKFAEVGLDAMPEDYKPQSWSAFAKDIVDIIRGEVNKESTAQFQSQQQFQQQVAQVDQGWEKEIKELTKAGDLQKNDSETVTKVFTFMKENNEKFSDNPNKQIWSFETAYKLMQASQVTDQRKQEIVQKRKARARATSGSASNDSGSGLPAIRPGESMDDIIARELGY